MRIMKLRSLFVTGLVGGMLMTGVACTPKIYVVDRQTVLEEEAAGQWPQFEKEVLAGAKAQGPTPYGKVPPNARRARLYNVLNGQMTSTSSKE